MKVISVVGARPQFVKLGPVDAAFREVAGVEHVIVHTGQHYDPSLSDVFFRDLDINAPKFHLGVGSGTHGVQTGAMLGALESVFAEQHPDWVLVYGDTNSTLAAAVGAVKLHIPVAHLEAGLRSFNRRMPEEHNRVLTDHAADLLLAPTATAMGLLAAEGLAGRSVLVGDVMTDVCHQMRERVSGRPLVLPAGMIPGAAYVVATIHRPDNTDDPIRLHNVIAALRALDAPVLLLAHPRLVVRASEFGIDLGGGELHQMAPLGYPEMVRTILGAAGVVTDSGGLQKEAYLLGRPCTTLRSETEWVETLENGWNVLDPDLRRVRTTATRPAPTEARHPAYGDGHAANRVVERLLQGVR